MQQLKAEDLTTSTEAVVEQTLEQAEAARLIENSTPEEVQAVMFLKQAVPYRKQLLYTASAATLRRVSSALDEQPFNDEPFVPTMGEEKELFSLGLQITNAKHILFQTALKDTAFTAIKRTLLENGVAEDVIQKVTEAITNDLRKASTKQEEPQTETTGKVEENV